MLAYVYNLLVSKLVLTHVVKSTIWIRLGDSDSKINDRLSVHFYSVAFLAFVSIFRYPSRRPPI